MIIIEWLYGGSGLLEKDVIDPGIYRLNKCSGGWGFVLQTGKECHIPADSFEELINNLLGYESLGLIRIVLVQIKPISVEDYLRLTFGNFRDPQKK